MRYLPISCVTPGMIIARTLYDAKGNALLVAGTVLTAGYLRRILDLGYPALYVCTPEDHWDDAHLVEPIRLTTRLRAQAALQRLSLDLGEKGICRDRLNELTGVVQELLDEALASREPLIGILEIRTCDSYTFGHSVNTCVLSLLAGVRLSLTPAELVTLGLGALLHDLGKIFVPGDILRKPASLTTDEYDQVKTHCQRGFNELKETLSPLAAHVAFQHHERCDGSGYPRGLTGEAMTRFAKLVAVADSFDAMTSHRVYCKPMVPEHAASILRSESPAKYDPECVDAVVGLIAPFTIGMVVKLDSGAIGEVVEATRDSTCVHVTRGPAKGRTLNCPAEAKIVECEGYQPLSPPAAGKGM